MLVRQVYDTYEVVEKYYYYDTYTCMPFNRVRVYRYNTLLFLQPMLVINVVSLVPDSEYTTKYVTIQGMWDPTNVNILTTLTGICDCPLHSGKIFGIVELEYLTYMYYIY